MTDRLILPLPPSVNHSHHQVRKGNRLMKIPSRQTKDFTHEAGWLAKEWAQKTGWTKTVKTKLYLRYYIYWPDRRKRDAGNVEKVLSDSLKGILFDDDQYVLPQAMDFSVDRGNPRVEVELEVKEVVTK